MPSLMTMKRNPMPSNANYKLVFWSREGKGSRNHFETDGCFGAPREAYFEALAEKAAGRQFNYFI
jgi:hypothetical protein